MKALNDKYTLQHILSFINVRKKPQYIPIFNDISKKSWVSQQQMTFGRLFRGSWFSDLAERISTDFHEKIPPLYQNRPVQGGGDFFSPDSLR